MVFKHNSDSDRCPLVIPVQAIESYYCTHSRTEGMPVCLASPVNKDVKKLQTEVSETCKLILLDYDSADEIFWGKAVIKSSAISKSSIKWHLPKSSEAISTLRSLQSKNQSV